MYGKKGWKNKYEIFKGMSENRKIGWRSASLEIGIEDKRENYKFTGGSGKHGRWKGKERWHWKTK